MTNPAPAMAPEVQPQAAVTPAENLAVAANDPARDKITPPENHLVDQNTVMPPKDDIKLPQPPIHTVAAPGGVAANDPAFMIEKALSPFMGDRMLGDSAKGIMIDVKLANSNAVTAEDGKPGQYDIAITFSGGALENPQQAQQVAEQLRAAMREHPAFKDMGFGGIDQAIEHMMRCQILSLNAEQIRALETMQPRKSTTFIDTSRSAANDTHMNVAAAAVNAAAAPAQHQCAGAGCAQCGASPAVVAATPAVAPATPAVAPEIQAVAPAVTQVAPATEVHAPGHHHGPLAANHHHLHQSA